MREDRVGRHVDGHADGLTHLVALGAGRDDEAEVQHRNAAKLPLHRRLGEVEAQARLVPLHLAALVVMHLDDDVRALGDGAAHALRHELHDRAGRPAAEAAVRREADAAKGGVARPRVEIVQATGPSLGVQVGQHVVDDASVAGAEFHRDDVAVLGQPARQHETTVDVAAAGGELVLLRHRQHQVRRAEAPLGGRPLPGGG